MKLTGKIKKSSLALGYLLYTLTSALYLVFKQIIRSGPQKAEYDGDNAFDIVCISHVAWNTMWQRNHHTMNLFSKKHKVLYCNPCVINLPNIEYISAILKVGKVTRTNNFLVTIPLLLPGEGRLPFIKRINKLILTVSIKDKIQEMHMGKIILWFYSPVQGYLLGTFNEVLSVYDIQDEYAEYLGRREEIKSRELNLLEKVDLVFTGTNSLFEEKGKLHRNIFFIPCGVDIEHFKKARKQTFPLPEDIRDIPHPIFGYFGMVCGRIDTDLLTCLASLHPKWSIVLIGEQVKEDFILGEMPNIHLLGKKDYRKLPDYLQAFDVCMIPFKLNELTLKVNPTKLLEYLAAGKPVVSTAIPDIIKFYSDVIEIAGNKEEFVRLAEKCMKAKDDGKAVNGMKLAENNSWEAMVDKMEDLILINIKAKQNTNVPDKAKK